MPFTAMSTTEAEHREQAPTSLAAVRTPFLLRLINGMTKNAPEVTVVVDKVVKKTKDGYYELHLGRIRQVKNWNRKREQPE